MQQIIDSGFSLNQANYDSCLVQAIVFLFLYVYAYIFNPEIFQPMTWIYANVYQILIYIGILFLSEALEYGKGGSIQAIVETKTIV
jgi:hypothetical protein